jgi:hypothetical protein
MEAAAGRVAPQIPDTPAAYESGGPGDPDARGAIPQEPNSSMLRFGKFGWLLWQSDNPIAVLALIMLCVLGAIEILLSLIAIVPSAHEWVAEPLKIIAQAMIAIVGAIIGAGASQRKS